MIPKYRQQPPKPPDEDFSPQMVVPSSTELFSFYRLTLAQCAKLSSCDRLVELTKVFAKYLDQYAQQILLFYVSERPSGQTPSKIPQIEDMILVLNTADYCFNTCTQLEEKIKSRIDESLRMSIDLQSQADAFMGIASATVRSLVRRVEVDIEPTWREMRNTGWSKMESVGDHSSYVGEMTRRIESKAGGILRLLNKQQYARAFCDNLVELIANTYLTNIFQCKPVSEVGAEQVNTHWRFPSVLATRILINCRCFSTPTFFKNHFPHSLLFPYLQTRPRLVRTPSAFSNLCHVSLHF